MTRRPDQVGVVAKFLRKELGEGPVPVSGLEATARTAGMLGEGRRRRRFDRCRGMGRIEGVIISARHAGAPPGAFLAQNLGAYPLGARNLGGGMCDRQSCTRKVMKIRICLLIGALALALGACGRSKDRRAILALPARRERKAKQVLQALKVRRAPQGLQHPLRPPAQVAAFTLCARRVGRRAAWQNAKQMKS
jgi:hypothetical protein